MSLLQNLVVGAMGVDDNAAEAWLEAWFNSTPVSDAYRRDAYRRAAAHWRCADEPLREAIASMVGWAEPNGERAPVSPAIRADYDWCVARACELLNPQDFA